MLVPSRVQNTLLLVMEATQPLSAAAHIWLGVIDLMGYWHYPTRPLVMLASGLSLNIDDLASSIRC